MPTTVNEVESVIKKLQDKQVQTVSFLRSLKITKMFSLSHFASLSILFLCLGLFPQQLKTAKVIPVYKNGDSLDCTNYRPVSLLSSLVNLIEKLFPSRINICLEYHKCFYKNQFGFRKKNTR